MNRVDPLPWLVRSVGATAAAFYGHIDPMIWLLVAVMGLDILSGVLAGGRAGELDSAVSYKGVRKKSMILLLVALAALLDANLPEATPVSLAVLVAGGFAASEALSIVENAGRLGVPIPAVLTDALARLSGRDGGR